MAHRIDRARRASPADLVVDPLTTGMMVTMSDIDVEVMDALVGGISDAVAEARGNGLGLAPTDVYVSSESLSHVVSQVLRPTATQGSYLYGLRLNVDDSLGLGAVRVTCVPA